MSNSNTARPLMNQDDHAEFRGQVVDILEDALADKEATIENEDREEAINEGEDPEGLAIIYGCDYDIIGDEVDRLIKEGALDTEAPQLTFDEVADRIMESYDEVCEKAEFPGDQEMTDEDKASIREMLLDLLRKWNAGK